MNILKIEDLKAVSGAGKSSHHGGYDKGHGKGGKKGS